MTIQYLKTTINFLKGMKVNLMWTRMGRNE